MTIYNNPVCHKAHAMRVTPSVLNDNSEKVLEATCRC